MRKLFVLFLASLAISCSTAAPKYKIAPEDWQAFDPKTSYHTRDTGDSSIYLTIKYSSHTSNDKSAETVLIAKSVFKQLARDLAKKSGKSFAVYDVSAFYESIAYNDVIGISTVIVSNDIKFTENLDDPDIPKKKEGDGDFNIVEKLEMLKEAFDRGLITEQEFVEKKKQLLEQY